MNKSKLLLMALLALVVSLITPALAGTITAKGSDTMVILVQKWAEVYMAGHPGTQIQVTGGGSGTGFAALINKTTDLCNASRKIKPAEELNCIKAFAKRPTEYKVCLDGLSVYVHEKNPIHQLTVGQLRDIFTGKVRNWKVLGGRDALITVYSRENSSGTYEFFKEHVLQGQDFTATAQTMPGTAAVLQAVGKDLNGIGYGGAAYGAGARHLKLSKDAGSPAFEPTEENVIAQKYPIWRYLFIYVNPSLDQGELAAYLSWIRSDAGQSVVKEIGYFPLPAEQRKR